MKCGGQCIIIANRSHFFVLPLSSTASLIFPSLFDYFFLSTSPLHLFKLFSLSLLSPRLLISLFRLSITSMWRQCAIEMVCVCEMCMCLHIASTLVCACGVWMFLFSYSRFVRFSSVSKHRVYSRKSTLSPIVVMWCDITINTFAEWKQHSRTYVNWVRLHVYFARVCPVSMNETWCALRRVQTAQNFIMKHKSTVISFEFK